MMIRLTWRRVGAALAAATVAGAGFWLAAPYNISARLEHWPPVEYLLHGYMRNAVSNRTALTDPPPDMDMSDPALLRLGAGHFVAGCATCHGAPGVPRNPLVLQMMPKPPYLPETEPLDLPEIHWLTYNGLKYTGMPGWAGAGRQDEGWAVAALVRALPGMSAETFRELAFAETDPPERAAMPFGTAGGTLSVVDNCARCHGADGLGRDGTAPKLAGQSPDHLFRALTQYATDARQSGIMEPLAATLTEDARRDLARHYASLPDGTGGTPPFAQGNAAQGERLARQGAADRQVGACLGCHGQPGNRAPRIAGQHGRFVAAWLALWREDQVTPGPDAARMHAAAYGLTDQDIADLAAYFAGRTAP